MINKITILSIILIAILTACSTPDPFEKSMRLGKDALIAENFEESVKQFDIALIEKPTNKDAISLYDRANKSLKEKQEADKKEKDAADAKRMIIDYEKQAIQVVNELKEFIDSIDINKVTVEQANILNEKNKLLAVKYVKIHGQWEDNAVIKEVHEHINTALIALDNSFQRIIEVPGSKYNGFGYSRAKFHLELWFGGVQDLKSK